jgi:hypothetical protein
MHASQSVHASPTSQCESLPPTVHNNILPTVKTPLTAECVVQVADEVVPVVTWQAHEGAPRQFINQHFHSVKYPAQLQTSYCENPPYR